MVFTHSFREQNLLYFFHLLSSLAWCNRLEQSHLYRFRGKFFCYKLLSHTRIAGGLLWKIFRFAPYFSPAHEPKQCWTDAARPFNGAAEPPHVVRRTAPSNTRIKLTAKLKKPYGFLASCSLSAAPLGWCRKAALQKISLERKKSISIEK